MWPFKRYSPPGNLLTIQSGETLLSDHTESLREIASLIGINTDTGTWRKLFLIPLQRYAAWVQGVPASQNHHHADRGGLLQHTLEATVYALRKRNGMIVPHDTAPESMGAIAPIWTYGVFLSALLHDLAKPAVDIEITLYDRQGRTLGLWVPFRGSVSDVPDAMYYDLQFVTRRGKRHSTYALLFAREILPAESMAYLSRDKAALDAFVATMQGDQANPIGEIVQLADSVSTKANLANGLTMSRRVDTSPSVFDRLKLATSYLISEGHCPLNKPGSMGFVAKGECWLVSKPFLDRLRLQLSEDGFNSVPRDNNRLMDMLLESNLIVPTEDARAVWRTVITIGDWRQSLSVLRLSGSLLDLEVASDDSVQVAVEGGQPPVDSPEALTVSESGEQDPESGTEIAEVSKTSIAEELLAWLRRGTQTSLQVNGAGALIHVVEYEQRKHVLLVSPALFRKAVSECPALEQLDYKRLQNEFQSLRLHQPNPRGGNFHTYQIVTRQALAKTLKGYLIEDWSLIFAGEPSLNGHLRYFDPDFMAVEQVG